MKYTVRILTALLVFTGVLLLLLYSIPSFISAANYGSESIEPLIGYNIFLCSLHTCALLTLGVLSLIQLKRSTPRLLLLFSGYALFSSLRWLAVDQWYGFLFMAAGLLSAIYEFITHGKLVKNLPLQRPKNSGLLIASGILACIDIAFRIYLIIPNVLSYTSNGSNISVSYYSSIFETIPSICIAVFCFLINRRSSVLYRMFFIGLSVFNAIDSPVFSVSYFVNTSMSEYFTINPVSIAGSVVSIVLVLLVLIHAIKTRHDGILPQEPAHLSEQQTEISAV